MMPATDLVDPEDRTSAGRKVKYLYCPDCGHYSGGRVCRQCRRGFGEFKAPSGGERCSPQGRGGSAGQPAPVSG